MRNEYEQTTILDRDTLSKIATAINARYVFQPRLVAFSQTMTDRWTVPAFNMRVFQTRSSLMRVTLQLWDTDTPFDGPQFRPQFVLVEKCRFLIQTNEVGVVPADNGDRIAMVAPEDEKQSAHEAQHDTLQKVREDDGHYGHEEWDELGHPHPVHGLIHGRFREFISHHDEDSCQTGERDLIQELGDEEGTREQEGTVNKGRFPRTTAGLDVGGGTEDNTRNG
jgi:hypothetical protein